MSTTDLPSYPMHRTCPFDPPPDQAAHGPITRVEMPNGQTPWLVSTYADQKDALADARMSADFTREGYPSTMRTAGARRSFISMDNPEHAVHRRALIKHFTVKRIDAMRDDIQALVDSLIDDMLTRGTSADLVRDFALPLPSMVICRMLGVPYADHDFFQAHSNAMLDTTISAEDRERVRDELSNYLLDLVERKVDAPEGDLISDVISTMLPGGTLTAQEIADMSMLLLIAGHETTANMISLGTLALLQNPTQLDELRTTDDADVIKGAVEELLRYLTITHQGRRRIALDDIEIAGQTVRAGEGVIFASDSANRDPDAFDGDPDELDIHRPARHHVAFGFGIHQCLGQALARLELEIVYGTLYRRIPTLALDAAVDDLDFKHEMAVYGVHSLPVRWSA